MRSRSVRSGARRAFSQRLMVLWSRPMRSPSWSWERPAARRVSRMRKPISARRWGTQSGRGSSTRSRWSDLDGKSLPVRVNLGHAGHSTGTCGVGTNYISTTCSDHPAQCAGICICQFVHPFEPVHPLTSRTATPLASPARATRNVARAGQAARLPQVHGTPWAPSCAQAGGLNRILHPSPEACTQSSTHAVDLPVPHTRV